MKRPGAVKSSPELPKYHPERPPKLKPPFLIAVKHPGGKNPVVLLMHVHKPANDCFAFSRVHASFPQHVLADSQIRVCFSPITLQRQACRARPFSLTFCPPPTAAVMPNCSFALPFLMCILR